jgi:hypothetical protein
LYCSAMSAAVIRQIVPYGVVKAHLNVAGSGKFRSRRKRRIGSHWGQKAGPTAFR